MVGQHGCNTHRVSVLASITENVYNRCVRTHTHTHTHTHTLPNMRTQALTVNTDHLETPAGVGVG